MKLSSRAKYGLRICFLLGLNENEICPLTTLVKQTDLSPKYLEQILAMLKNGGIVNSKRGVDGGYILSRPAEEITILEILKALHDDFEITECVTNNCSDDYCPNRNILKKLYETVNNTLNTTSLREMIEDYRKNCKDGRQH